MPAGDDPTYHERGDYLGLTTPGGVPATRRVPPRALRQRPPRLRARPSSRDPRRPRACAGSAPGSACPRIGASPTAGCRGWWTATATRSTTPARYVLSLSPALIGARPGLDHRGRRRARPRPRPLPRPAPGQAAPTGDQRPARSPASRARWSAATASAPAPRCWPASARTPTASCWSSSSTRRPRCSTTAPRTSIFKSLSDRT